MVYPKYGDLKNTWAQGDDYNANHFIEVEYAEDVYVTQINIYETFNAGGVVRVGALNPNTNTWSIIWESLEGPIYIESSRIFSPKLNITSFKTKNIRLDVDTTAAESYCEIDAIELVGKRSQEGLVSV